MRKKKNVRIIPSSVRAHLEILEIGKGIVCACTKSFPAQEIMDGSLSHLGIGMSQDGVVLTTMVSPSAASGKYSSINQFGQEVIRKDLPKEKHHHPVEVPNWGDAATYGTHIVHLPYEMYPRDFNAPIQACISIECLDSKPGLEEYVFHFSLDEVLDRSAANFESRLLYGLNILQENIGHCGVRAVDASPQEYMKSYAVEWEILPPGTAEEALNKLFQSRRPNEAEQGAVLDRYHFLMGLEPQSIIYGRSGFQRYFGAMLAKDLVVFENIEYGNAVYVMFGDWEQLSRQSRIELMSGRCGTSFERIVHSPNWKKKLEEVIEKRLKQK